MIVIEKVSWINFLSTGNIETEVSIADSKTTLIAGENGSGKSTIMDALCYCLFKKAFRKINLPQLVNSITGKGMMTEVSFQANGHSYKIRRGAKPAVFEIYQDGTLINQDADTRDYQKTLEQNILKMNYKTFCQIVVLGSANFTPFMQLTPHQRREIIEDLLDIQVFSLMNMLLKEKISANKDALNDVDHQISKLESILDLQRKHKRELEQRNKEYVKDRNDQIDAISEIISANQEKIEAYTQEIEDLQSSMDGWGDVKERMEKSNTLQVKLESAIRKATKEIKFYSDTVSCPTCKQGISEDFKALQISSYQKKLLDYQGKERDLDGILLQLLEKEKAFKQVQEKLLGIQRNIAALLAENKTQEQHIKSIRRVIQKIAESREEASEDKESETLAQISKENERKRDLLDERELNNVALMLLKDGGIKTQIIKQYIPVMNTLINKYLDQMEFFCQFEINEQFEEVIKSRYRDEFSYDSFSQGEKMRIDLSLLFAWREIARMRNSASVNLLILDEIMDSSLDANGTDEFSKIIGNLTGENNVIVISHKSDQIQDRFDRTIRFEKVKNFSRIKQ